MVTGGRAFQAQHSDAEGVLAPAEGGPDFPPLRTPRVLTVLTRRSAL